MEEDEIMGEGIEKRRIFDSIEAERKERRADIADIHARIDRLPDEIIKRLPKIDSNASWVRQSVGLTIAVMAIIASMFGIVQGVVNPIQLQLNYLKSDAQAIEKRAVNTAGIIAERIRVRINSVAETANINNNRLDERLMVEINGLEETNQLNTERHQARLEKLEEWQKWWYRSAPEISALQDGKIEMLEKSLLQLPPQWLLNRIETLENEKCSVHE